MFCKHCGARLKPESKFCESCGNPREVKREPEKHAVPASHDDKKDIKGGGKGSAVAIIITSIIAGVILAWIFLSVFPPGSSSPQSSSTNATSSNNGTGAQTYYLSNGNFSVYFPAQPTYSVTSQELTAGNNVTDDNYSWGLNGGVNISNALEATFISDPFANSNLTPQEKLNNEINYNGNSGGSSIISSSPTTFDGFPAIDYVLSIDNSTSSPILYATGRDTLTNKGLYMLEYYYRSGQENKQLKNTFLSSLTFGTPTDATEPKAPSSPSQSTSPQSQSTAPTSGSLTTALINEIEPSIVEVNCYSANGNVVVSGSGTSNLSYGVLHITTNYHVYNEASGGGGSPTCYAVYPEPPNFSYNAEYGDYQLVLVSHQYDTATYEDEAEFTIGSLYPSATPLSPLPSINNLPLTGIGGTGCSDATVGDSVTVFGYPASGNALGISETVTQGTIAGILPGPIYKFDGAIDHGNSGGLAVLDKDSCVLGIPTLGDSGLTAGIGYIQSFVLAAQPVTQTNAQVCQNDYGPYSVWGGQLNSTGGPTCDCEAGYAWNSYQTECIAMTPNQICAQDVGAGSYYLGYNNSNGSYACSSPY